MFSRPLHVLLMHFYLHLVAKHNLNTNNFAIVVGRCAKIFFNVRYCQWFSNNRKMLLKAMKYFVAYCFGYRLFHYHQMTFRLDNLLKIIECILANFALIFLHITCFEILIVSSIYWSWTFSKLSSHIMYKNN